MKKTLLISGCLIFILLLLNSCGETKKESASEESKGNISSGKTSEETGSSQKKDDIPEGVTILGEAPEAVEPEKKDYTKEALRCQIVLLEDAVSGKFRKLTKPSALEFTEQGKILVVRAENGAIFFVYNEDGSFGSKNLARYAANDFIGILGKTKYKYDLNFIFAEYIESSD